MLLNRRHVILEECHGSCQCKRRLSAASLATKRQCFTALSSARNWPIDIRYRFGAWVTRLDWASPTSARATRQRCVFFRLARPSYCLAIDAGWLGAVAHAEVVSPMAHLLSNATTS